MFYGQDACSSTSLLFSSGYTEQKSPKFCSRYFNWCYGSWHTAGMGWRRNRFPESDPGRASTKTNSLQVPTMIKCSLEYLSNVWQIVNVNMKSPQSSTVAFTCTSRCGERTPRRASAVPQAWPMIGDERPPLRNFQETLTWGKRRVNILGSRRPRGSAMCEWPTP